MRTEDGEERHGLQCDQQRDGLVGRCRPRESEGPGFHTRRNARPSMADSRSSRTGLCILWEQLSSIESKLRSK